jgi:hypothetical protein
MSSKFQRSSRDISSTIHNKHAQVQPIHKGCAEALAGIKASHAFGGAAKHRSRSARDG